jgi:hypothetical protein
MPFEAETSSAAAPRRLRIASYALEGPGREAQAFASHAPVAYRSGVRQRSSITVIAVTALIASLTALSAIGLLANVFNSRRIASGDTATPILTSSSSTLGIVQFTPSGTQAQFLALMKDMTIDAIEMQSGTYRGWHLFFDVDRTARPLVIRPAAGATVVFDDAGGRTADGLFYPGWTSYTSNITFQGPFQITNYVIGQTGLVSTAWAANLAFNGFTVRGTTAPTTNGQTAWAVYVSSDGAHRGTNLTFNDWNVDNTSSAAGHEVNGLQLYHTPQAVGVTALRWRIAGSNSAMTLYGDATGIDVEYWTITNSDYAVKSDGIAAGVLRNNTATGSTYAPIIQSPLVDGGGNAWH